MPLVVNLLGAILIARSASGERAIAADQFFKGNFETALDASELLAEIRVPLPAKGHGWSFQEVSQRMLDAGTPDDVLDCLAAGVDRMTRMDCVVFLTDKYKKRVIHKYHTGKMEHPEPRLDSGQGLTYTLIQTNRLIEIPDVRADPRVNPVLVSRYRSITPPNAATSADGGACSP